VTDIQVLFTANLKADFEFMPYLATLIRQARNPSTPTLLMDVGGAASTDHWLCRATENRAPYIVLDAMGYTLARADALDVSGILGLRGTVNLFLTDDSIAYQWHYQDIALNVGPVADAPCVTWTLPDWDSELDDGLYQHRDDGVLWLAQPDGFIGNIIMDYPSMQVHSAEKIPFVRKRPDPSIIEMVKFVEWEAKAYLNRGGKDT
jgi:hypothetical protein